MPYCNICGQEIETGLLCSTHQEDMEALENGLPPPEEAPPKSEEPMQEEGAVATTIPPKWVAPWFRTADNTHRYKEEDVKRGLWSGVICYLGPLWLIPFCFGKKNPYVRYHMNQGLLLFLLELLTGLIVGAACLVDPWLPVVTPVMAAGGELMGLTSLFLCGVGVWNALKGRAQDLPLVGETRLV